MTRHAQMTPADDQVRDDGSFGEPFGELWLLELADSEQN
jgi:hypothetical protein